MYVLAAIILYLVLYPVIGWRIAIRDLPRAWIYARKEWTTTDYQENCVRAQFLCMIFFWPILSPIRQIGKHLNEVINTADPKVIQARLRAQEAELARRQRRIAELERETRTDSVEEFIDELDRQLSEVKPKRRRRS